MDSIASPKVKTKEGEEDEVRSLACNTLRVEGCVGALEWDYDKRQAIQLLTWICINQKQIG
jgi:hypothetical protein